MDYQGWPIGNHVPFVAARFQRAGPFSAGTLETRRHSDRPIPSWVQRGISITRSAMPQLS
jgi:hypothetical protein